ncbi:NTP transferase domain-containing protein [Paenibacillus sp. TAF43_2]|uniref:nucleotidyltransferase family protein n=1 Tax=Paenibacillus sp. TAF43_2 TaxID=3233069 RepID=UPI003F9A1883
MRMGVRKQSLELSKNKPLARMGLLALLSSDLHEIKVVVNPEDSNDWIQAEDSAVSAAHHFQSSGVTVIECADAQKGMSYSIRCGLEALLREGAALDAVVVVLADQPFITSGMINRLIRCWSERPELDFVATAVHEANEGEIVLMPPAILSRSMFDSLFQLKGDAGARKLFGSTEFQGYGLLALDRETLFDVDTPADFALAKKRYLGLSKEC